MLTRRGVETWAVEKMCSHAGLEDKRVVAFSIVTASLPKKWRHLHATRPQTLSVQVSLMTGDSVLILEYVLGVATFARADASVLV